MLDVATIRLCVPMTKDAMILFITIAMTAAVC